MEVYTIGFAGKTAQAFFGRLRSLGIKRLVDVRLNNTPQMAGFTKRQDLAFFLMEICGAEYVHEKSLAPTHDLLKGFRSGAIGWDEYERRYLELLEERRVGERLSRGLFEGPAVLLCSEPTPERCHRRLALEYLDRRWGGLEIVHI